jgi:hypothetical protein
MDEATGNVHRIVAAEQCVPIFVSCRVGSTLLCGTVTTRMIILNGGSSSGKSGIVLGRLVTHGVADVLVGHAVTAHDGHGRVPSLVRVPVADSGSPGYGFPSGQVARRGEGLGRDNLGYVPGGKWTVVWRAPARRHGREQGGRVRRAESRTTASPPVPAWSFADLRARVQPLDVPSELRCCHCGDT